MKYVVCRWIALSVALLLLLPAGMAESVEDVYCAPVEEPADTVADSGDMGAFIDGGDGSALEMYLEQSEPTESAVEVAPPMARPDTEEMLFVSDEVSLFEVQQVMGAASSDGFVVENGVLVQYKGGGWDIVIPGNVTSIDENAFSMCRSVSAIQAGANATIGLINLTSVTIPSSVTYIHPNAFSTCNKATFKVEKGSYAEQYCIDNGLNYTIVELSVRKVATPTKILLNTEEQGVSEGIASFKLSATFIPQDDDLTVHNIIISVILPEGVNTESTLDKVLEELPPQQFCDVIADETGNRGKNVELGTITVPIGDQNANYTWKVNATSEDYATGVVCTAQDTFSVAARLRYEWDFKRDSYSFLNDFGYLLGIFDKPYYVSDSDFDAFKYALSSTDLYSVAMEYGAKANDDYTTAANFLDHKLINWIGSCYGMSLSAALFKTGILSPSDYGADTTYGLSLDNVESMINVYQMSQMTGLTGRIKRVNGDEYNPVLKDMYNMAVNVNNAGSRQQPFLVDLWLASREDGVVKGTESGHTIICYGAESVDNPHQNPYLIRNGIEYDKRLLIADPNKTEKTFLYIDKDFTTVYYSGNSKYDMFGYPSPSLSRLNSYSHTDITSNYAAWLKIRKDTSVTVSSKDGSATFIGGLLTKISGIISVLPFATENGDESNDIIYFIDGDTSFLELTPVSADGSALSNGGTVNATICNGDHITTITGTADSVNVQKDGNVQCTAAKDNLSVTLVADSSDFGFAHIEGSATGNVALAPNSHAIDIKGSLSDYTVSNTDRDANTAAVAVNVNGDATATMQGKNVVVNVDADKDGKADTKVSSSDVPITNLSFDRKEITLTTGASWTAVVHIEPETAKDTALAWTSSDPTTVSVKDGVITAHKAGGATVYVAPASDTSKQATIEVYVENPTVPVTQVTLSQSSIELIAGNDCFMPATVLPEDATDKGVVWSSSNPAIATYDDGMIKAIAPGTAVITAASAADNSKSASCTVTVVEKTPEKLIAKKGNNGTVNGVVGGKLQLLPTFATDEGYTVTGYKSSKARVATVDANGLVTAVGEGKAKITITTSSKKRKATITLKISDPNKPTGVTLDQGKAITIAMGTPLQLTAALSPASAQSALTWKSSKTKVATVDGNGLVTPMREGKTKITVTTRNKKKTTITVTVVDPFKPTGVLLNYSGTVQLKVGETLQLKATMAPAEAQSGLGWNSSKSKVASVSAAGGECTVTALKKGSTKITVQTWNKKRATIKVVVVE